MFIRVYVSKAIIVQVSPCAKLKLKWDAKGLSICVVLEEKFEQIQFLFNLRKRELYIYILTSFYATF